MQTQKRIEAQPLVPAAREQAGSSNGAALGGPVGELMALIDSRLADMPPADQAATRAQAVAYPAPRFDPVHAFSIAAGYAALGAALFGLGRVIGLL